MIIVFFIFHIFIWFAHGTSAIRKTNDSFLFKITICWLISVLYTTISYFSAAFSNPGFLTEDWNEKNPSKKIDTTDEDDKLFCDQCKISRPPRTHHCKTCNKCVLMMDHHCVFIDNCVGFRTFRPYFAFLVGFPLEGIFGMVMMICNIDKVNKSAFEGIVFGLSAMYYGIFLLIDFYQLFSLLSNLIHNSSEVENERDNDQKPEYELMGIRQVSEFDTGSLYANIKQKLGDFPLVWLFPLPRKGDYFIMPKNPKFVPYSKVKLKKST